MSTDLSAEFDQLKRRSRRHWHYALIIVAATALNLARVIEAEPLQSANDRSRWTTVWSLVHRGTYQIDEIRRKQGWDTIDLVRHEEHFYSTKPPLLSTLVAGLYWGITHTLRWTLDAHLLATTRLLIVLVNLLPATIALVLLTRLLDRYALSDFARYFLIISASLATLLQPFLVTLNNHTPAAYCCVFALYALIRILVEGSESGWQYALAGWWAACTCSVELTAALFGLAAFVLLARHNLRQTAIWFVPAAIVPLAAFFVTNYLATGGWKPFYMYYGTEKYEFFENGMPSYWMNPRGIDQAKDDLLVYILHCTIGHHGIWSLTPIYLLTLGGWLIPKSWTESPLRVFHALGCLLTGALFVFFLTKTENYNYGGVSVALRWMLWLTPFWLLAMIPALDAWRPELRGRIFCCVLLGWSVFSAWYPFSSPWRQPWLFELMTLAGWIDYSDPKLTPQPFYSWIRALPPATDDAPPEPYWIEFEGLSSTGHLVRLRLESAPSADIPTVPGEGRQLVPIRVTRTRIEADGQSTVLSDWVIAIDATDDRDDIRPPGFRPFPDSRPLHDIIAWSQGTPAEPGTIAETILRGLPERVARSKDPKAIAAEQGPRYTGKVVRYVDRPLLGRTERFRCIQAAGEVSQPATGNLPRTVHRRDIWMTDDVPFGVLAFETSVRDPRTGEVLTRQRMSAVNASRVEPFRPTRLARSH
ncbi:MAG: hypothetical protein KF861_05105 [Planctomycetaceae bacterium]|nr:hypothetical protein [Planctomycetaceae bacterium]